MNAKVVLVLRVLLALIMIVFGLNKFIGFMPQPAPEGDIATYFTALSMVHLMPTILGVLEIATGLAFLTGRYVALALVINAPLAFNAVLFHLVLDPANVALAAVWLVLVVVLLIANKDRYSELLRS